MNGYNNKIPPITNTATLESATFESYLYYPDTTFESYLYRPESYGKIIEHSRRTNSGNSNSRDTNISSVSSTIWEKRKDEISDKQNCNENNTNKQNIETISKPIQIPISPPFYNNNAYNCPCFSNHYSTNFIPYGSSYNPRFNTNLISIRQLMLLKIKNKFKK